MKIIIVGAGKVGFTLAEHLSQEGHDVTIIDRNETAIRHASDALDVMCIKGSGASPATLKAAGAEATDFLLATTSLDEVNMLCSLMAKQLGTKYTIVRIRDVDYTSDLAAFQRDLNIDMVINPEFSTAIEISHLLRYPPAANIDTFLRGGVELLSTMVKEGDFIIGHSLAELSSKIQNLSFLFCAALRGDEILIPQGSFVPMEGDRLYVIGTPAGLHQYFRMLGRYVPKVHSVMMVGGSRIAHYLANMLSHMHMKVTIVDNQLARCQFLSERLPKALVLCGDGTDQELLTSEHFANHDAFIALTGRDEDNLLIALYARQQGLKKVIAKSNRDNYTGIAHSAGLESILSPKLVTVGRILRVVRGFENKKGELMHALYRFADNEAEAAEFEISADTPHLGVPLKELPLKPGILICAISHGSRIIIPSGSDTLSTGDRVIIVSREEHICEFGDVYLTHKFPHGDA